MYSPFYLAEIKAFYPNRIVEVLTKTEVSEKIGQMITNGIITIDTLCNTSLGQLKHTYFLNTSIDDILSGIQLYKSKN